MKSKRNRLAGTKKGKSDSARYYQENPKARKKKKDYDSEYHSSEDRKRYRAELNKANSKRGKIGDGKDMSHTRSGKLVSEDQRKNRARNRGRKAG